MAIELDRRFVECRENEQITPDVAALYGGGEGTLGWTDLLARRRVVFLAEAGSGKTTEMQARAQQQANAGHPSFYATVEDVGRKGFEAALRPVDRAALTTWRSSDNEGWFFIDSVDEAKQSGVKLLSALRAIAEAIAGAERRAHIVLSGRYTDWQFRRDLSHFKEELGIPPDAALPPPPTPEELVISTIHRERREQPKPPEDTIVVVMSGLDEERVCQFAIGKNVENLDAFIGQIESGNLWQFARRPLDLDWLAQFWHSHKRLGNLAEMLDICIAERLRESNHDRARLDGLDVARALQSIERIGAAMVFSRRETVAVPDTEISLTDTSTVLDIADVLPDWSPQDRERLLTRAVFDPATFGRARIHNDNQGVVRSYLAARWLRRLRQSNLSQQGLFDLLFAESYGVSVIKPSMQEIAAWLSLWDETVAREVSHRAPFLLLTAGDPATLSRQTRENLLAHVVKLVVVGEKIPLLDLDSLKRFSRSDLAPAIHKFWNAHSAHAEARKLLLRVIWLGGIQECANLAETAAFLPNSNGRVAVFAGRAMMATADDAGKKRYAAFVKANCTSLSTTVVWDALEKMVPNYLGIDELLAILSRIDVTDRGGGLGLDWHGPKLVEHIRPRADLEKLLLGLLTQLGGTAAAGDRGETAREEAYFPMIAKAAELILELCPENEASIIALDAAVRIGEGDRISRSARRKGGDLTAELQRSPARRRLAFWRFAERLAGHQMLQGRPINSAWDLQILGFPVSFEAVDIDWLLADAPTRTLDNERELAINTAIMIGRDQQPSGDVLDRIQAVATADQAMAKAFDSWTKPAPKPAALVDSEKRLEQLQRRNAIERAAHDQSWVDFVAKLRADPDSMRNLRPTTSNGVDAKLFRLWELLSHVEDSNHRYAIESVAALEPMIGAEAAEGFRLGLIAHWRAWAPWLYSTRKDEELNQVRFFDRMGVAGITLEAIGTPDWAAGLTNDDAARAAGYATLELNGFPKWLVDLAVAKPNVVREVLSREVESELARPRDSPSFGVLQDLARGDVVIAELMTPMVLAQLEKRSTPAITFLSPILDIIVRGHKAEPERIKTLAIERFMHATDPAVASLYIRAVFSIDGATATDAVFAKLDKLKRMDQPAFVQQMLPHVFGRWSSDDPLQIENLPLNSLERLIRLAFITIRLDEDNIHPSGVVFSPDARDNAESARGAAFSALVNTPGRAAFNAILGLAKFKDFPIPKVRLRELAKERAAQDSESACWKPGEVFAFEQTAETEPQTARDLQMVALRRLVDMQYDLLHDDFQQGETLSGLGNEKAVQKWIADRLRLKQGRSYSVEREVHVANEKEPDIRLRAKKTDASVPIEVKVAETWTIPQLEAALTTQLCDKYLRSRNGRHGILLLVHQKPKPRGWIFKNKRLTFVEVVGRLRAMAGKIAGSASDAPQPEIALLDVAAFAKKKAKKKLVKKKAGKKRASKSKASKKRALPPRKRALQPRSNSRRQSKD